MGKGRRLKSERKSLRDSETQLRGAGPQMPEWEEEYPYLEEHELTESTGVLLKKSRRSFIGSSPASTNLDERLAVIIGAEGDYERSSTKTVDQWMSGWSMPSSATGHRGRRTSQSVFVGIKPSIDMPSSTGPGGKNPNVTITTGFIDRARRIANVFPMFSSLYWGGQTATEGQKLRQIALAYVEGADAELDAEIETNTDRLFATRITAAAVRWAIGHEMSHVTATKEELAATYERAIRLHPNMVQERWDPIKDQLKDYHKAVMNYRKEIACDALATEHVYSSTFSASDIAMQACGAFLAMQTIILDEHFVGARAVSDTHPSSQLRFDLVCGDWLDRILEAKSKGLVETPGRYALSDIAMWPAFRRWLNGAYRPEREGSRWRKDIDDLFALLGVGAAPLDDIYQLRGSDISRLRRP